MAPKNIKSFESGMLPSTVWVIDEFGDVFYYDGKHWDIISGKFTHITVGDSGIFALDKDGYLFKRDGISTMNGRGTEWFEVADDQLSLVYLESAPGNLLYGIDNDGNLLYVSTKGREEDLQDEWQMFQPQQANGGSISEGIKSISCGYYSCFIVTRSGRVFSTTSPREPVEKAWLNLEGTLFIDRRFTLRGPRLPLSVVRQS